MLRVTTSVSARGQQLVLEKVLASGGEGKIWSVQGHPQQFAKIYKAPTKEHEAKLKIMLASPPRDPGRSMGHISLAWPQELLFDPNGNCKGFLMPAIDRVCYVPLFKAYVPDKRLQLPEGFTWERPAQLSARRPMSKHHHSAGAHAKPHVPKTPHYHIVQGRNTGATLSVCPPFVSPTCH